MKIKCTPSLLLTLTLWLVLLYAFCYGQAFVQLYRVSHSYEAASKWIFENIPAGSKLLGPHWDDRLPVSLPGYDTRKYVYECRECELPFYESDSLQTLQVITDRLAGGDYIIFPTPRIPGSIPRIPEEYPRTTAMLQLLWSGKLGYTLLEVVKTRPTLLGISLNDDLADESFSVYDHPKVTIFKNEERLSAQELRSRILNAESFSPLPTLNQILLTDSAEDNRSYGPAKHSMLYSILGPLLLVGITGVLVRSFLPRTLRRLPDAGIGIALLVAPFLAGIPLGLISLIVPIHLHDASIRTLIVLLWIAMVVLLIRRCSAGVCGDDGEEPAGITYGSPTMRENLRESAADFSWQRPTQCDYTASPAAMESHGTFTNLFPPATKIPRRSRLEAKASAYYVGMSFLAFFIAGIALIFFEQGAEGEDSVLSALFSIYRNSPDNPTPRLGLISTLSNTMLLPIFLSLVWPLKAVGAATSISKSLAISVLAAVVAGAFASLISAYLASFFANGRSRGLSVLVGAIVASMLGAITVIGITSRTSQVEEIEGHQTRKRTHEEYQEFAAWLAKRPSQGAIFAEGEPNAGYSLMSWSGLISRSANPFEVSSASQIELVANLYKSPDIERAYELASKGGIDLIVVGSLEREIFTLEALEKFSARPDLFAKVFEGRTVSVYAPAFSLAYTSSFDASMR